MNISIIKKLKKFLNAKMQKISPLQRKRKITFKDVIYYSSLMSANNYSYDVVNSVLKTKNILQVSKNALIKKKSSIKYTFFETFNREFLNYIYDKDNKKRYIAVDGSTITFKKHLVNEGFKLGKYKHYCKGLLSSLYDLDKQIPINLRLFKSFNERQALTEQLDYVNAGDVLIMDRGYWSKQLYKTLISKNIHTIFRLKKNLNIIKEFENDTYKKRKDKVITLCKKQFRILRYTIKSTNYYIGTTLINCDRYDINFFKNKYWNRWDVETNFKCLKYEMSLNMINDISENKIKQKIAIHNFISILSGYFENELNSNNDNKKINRKNSINLVSNKLLYLMFYKKITKKIRNKIQHIITTIKGTTIMIKKGRNFTRLRKRPVADWGWYKYNFFPKSRKKK